MGNRRQRVFRMSFPRAVVRRFNESVSSTPAPTAYDPKDVAKGKGSYAPEFRAQRSVCPTYHVLPGHEVVLLTFFFRTPTLYCRFSDPKEVTPGPGQYDTSAKEESGGKKCPQKKKLLATEVGGDGGDVFRTPCWKGPRPGPSSALSSRRPPARSSSTSSLGCSCDAEQLRKRCAQLEEQLSAARAQLAKADSQGRERQQEMLRLQRDLSEQRAALGRKREELEAAETERTDLEKK